ncbi:MAG: hypothetical protein ACRDGI_02805, partial [Candidatus Limnocylindrales bacterium]
MSNEHTSGVLDPRAEEPQTGWSATLVKAALDGPGWAPMLAAVISCRATMNPRPAVFVLALLVVSACSPVAIVSTQPSASPTLVASPPATSQASPIPPSAAPSDVGLRLPNPGGT